MRNKILPIFLISIFIIIFVIFYKSLKNTNIYTPETKTNNQIPSFSSELLYLNKVVKSSDIFNSDKFYLLNIWSSWCVPCRLEHPMLMELNKNINIKVIGINYKDTKKNAKFFLEELGNPFEKIFLDKEGIKAIEWAAYGVPESFLIYENKIIKRYIGPLSKQSYEEIKLLIK